MSLGASIVFVRRWLAAFDGLVAIGVGTGISWVYYGSLAGWGLPWPGVSPAVALFACAAGWVSLLVLCGAYDRHRFLARKDEARRIAWAGLLLLAGLSGFLYFSHNVQLSPLFPLAFAAGVTVLTVAGRFAARTWLTSLRRQGHNQCRVLVIGVGASARRFAEGAGRQPELGVDIVGFLDGENREICGHAVLGKVHEFHRVLAEHVVDEVVVAQPGLDREVIEEIVATCAELGLVVHLAADIVAVGRARCVTGSVADLPALSFVTGPGDGLALVMKRIVDFAGAFVGLLAAIPLFLAVAALIKLESPGPVFFAQERVGLHGRRFRMFKFRSMTADAESRLAKVAHLNEVSGPVFKIANDPRVTRVGRLLRRTSLDELPQLWNVLRGEMSLVGPRPPLSREVEQYSPRERRRLSVKPGLTCLWQVSGRNKLSFDRWVELDLEYIDRWSLWLDIKIIFRTIPQVLGMSGV